MSMEYRLPERSRVPGTDYTDWSHAASACEHLLRRLGADIDSDGMKDTARRMLNAYLELTEGVTQDAGAVLRTQFVQDCDEMVVVRRVPFWSLCEHHMLPFHGHVTVGYLPKGGRVVGLSKIPRLVRVLSRRPQIQERLTREIGMELGSALHPGGVAVYAEALHLCMAMRGAEAQATMVTSYLEGAFREDEGTRAEFLSLARA